jgi:DNA polymerase-1
MEQFPLPNVRRLFQPDPGHIIADCDLDRADLQVVVWEADDDDLKAKLREGADIHAENAKDLNISRPLAKAWVHGTNYGGSPHTMARNCGITVAQAERMRNRWFQIHPGIKDWHERTEHNLMVHRSVQNAFGFRRFYFDRVEGLLPQGLAWIPQSTVAIVTNKGILNLHRNLPQVNVLLQVHDSIVFQIPKGLFPGILPAIREQLLIEIPYPEPLVIPVGIQVSETSWGDVKEVDWETGKRKVDG